MNLHEKVYEVLPSEKYSIEEKENNTIPYSSPKTVKEVKVFVDSTNIS